MSSIGHPPLAAVMDLLLDAVCVVDPQGRFLFISAAGERIFGYPPQEMMGRPMIEFVHPDDRARTLGAVDEIVAGTHTPHFENRYVRKDGRSVHIMWSARWSPQDQVRVAVARDVTRRKHAESMQAALYAISEAAYAARDLQALFERVHRIVGELIPASTFLVALHDRESDTLTVPYRVGEHKAPGARGCADPDSLLADVIRSGRELHGPHAGPLARAAAPATDTASAIDRLVVPLVASQGVIGALWVESHSPGVNYASSEIELLKFVSTQVAAAIERKQREARLQHMALHDPLTGLPNRSLVVDRMSTALAQARRERTRLALLYLDIDGFKQVNDTLGHAGGDALLREVGQRLKGCVRESDTAGRMGGDEFVVLLVGVQSPEQAVIVADKVRAALCRPFQIAGRTVSASPSIGMAHHPEDGGDAEALLRRADEAMYRAKHAGGNRLEVAGAAV